jgi:hypothetical protein
VKLTFVYIMLEILCEADFCIHNAGNIKSFLWSEIYHGS